MPTLHHSQRFWRGLYRCGRLIRPAPRPLSLLRRIERTFHGLVSHDIISYLEVLKSSDASISMIM